MRDHLGKMLGDLYRGDDQLVVLGRVPLGNDPRVLALVERGRAVEADGEGLDRTVDHGGQQGDDDAGVDAARQEHAQRHVGDPPQSHRVLEQRPEGPGESAGVGLGQRAFVGNFVVTIGPGRPVLDVHGVTGEQLGDVSVEGAVPGQVLQAEQLGQQRRVQLVAHVGVAQQHRDLGGEDDPSAVVDGAQEQRLDAQPVTGQEGLAPAAVVDAEGEHPVEPMHQLGTVFFPQVHQDLGVGAGAEAMPAGDQPLAQLSSRKL